eukprot:gene17544-23865_t
MIANRRMSAPSQRTSAVTCSSARSLAVSSRVHLTGYGEQTRVNSLSISMPTSSRATGARGATMMANKGTSGPFAPLVVITRNLYGEKEFNKFRGKAISLHSQVIKDFCKPLGVDGKQIQGVIRLAKKNGEKLGFLA